MCASHLHPNLGIQRPAEGEGIVETGRKKKAEISLVVEGEEVLLVLSGG